MVSAVLLINILPLLPMCNFVKKYQFFTSEMLPTASTCFNRLHLPNYDTEEKLRIKVKAAVEFGSEGFGFM